MIKLSSKFKQNFVVNINFGSSMHNISKISLKTSTAHIKLTTTSIFAMIFAHLEALWCVALWCSGYSTLAFGLVMGSNPSTAYFHIMVHQPSAS